MARKFGVMVMLVLTPRIRQFRRSFSDNDAPQVRCAFAAGVDLRRHAPAPGGADASYADGPDIMRPRPRSRERTSRNGYLRATDRASRDAGARSRPSRAARTDIRPRRRYSARWRSNDRC